MVDNIGLRFGDLEPGTMHLCIDMQCLFGPGTPWHTPWLERVLPTVLELAERFATRTIFTRFLPPADPSQAGGAWRRYYERWPGMTRQALDPALLELVPALRRLVPPATVLDKYVNSAFANRRLVPLLAERRCGTLVITGGETDVCVLATVMGAIDRGYRVVLAMDGLCSSQDSTHDALMLLYRSRFTQQVECAPTDEIVAAWRP
jgi:nicotinamidase-related amidase